MQSTARWALISLLGTLLLAACAGPSPTPTEAPAFALEVLLPGEAPQLTANVRMGDLLGDGSPQVFIAEPLRGQVLWLHGPGDLVALKEGLRQPVRTHVADVDGDGHQDLLVADIGIFFPDDRKVGRVVLLRNDGAQQFEPVVLLENVGRVTCAEAADLDGDGDLDIAVCVFGDIHGKLVWIEQREGFTFEEHVLDDRPGVIHALPFDADGDGDLDLAVSLSQDFEEVLLFRNQGGGAFSKEVLFRAPVNYYGMSGIELTDLDRDGDTDILVTNGDLFDGDFPEGTDPYELYGVAWLENDGLGTFTYRDVARHWGAYAVRALDVDGDADLDLVLSSLQIPALFPDAPVKGLVWLENDGAQNFTVHTVQVGVASAMLTIEVGDIDNDGLPEILGGVYEDTVTDSPGPRLAVISIPRDSVHAGEP